MKKVFLTLLAVIVIVGAFAGAGYWGYRIGYANGATGPDNGPFFARPYHMDPSQMPMYKFGGEFNRDFGFNRHPMMRPGSIHGIGMGYGYFSPFLLLWRVIVIALIIWFVYWLFTKSGWQLTRKTNNDPESTGN